MASKYIIECPNCKVRFFVTDDLLSAADGDLRCGFCMHVFNGNDYIVYKTLPSSYSATVAETSVSSEEHSESALKKTVQRPDGYWDDVIDKLSDFSVDLKTLNIEKEVPSQDETDEVFVVPTQQGLFRDSEMEAGDGSANIDVDIVEQLKHVDFDHLLQLDEQELVTRQSKDVVSLLIPDEDEDVNADQQSLPFDELEQAKSEDDAPKDIYGNRLKKVSDLDFMVAGQSGAKASGRHTVLWSLLSLVAVLVLAGQYLRFVLPEMAKSEVDREMAKQVCEFLWCDIPDLVDVNEIVTKQLLVRSNPVHEEVLNVDAVVVNELPVAQKFPVIELYFTGLNGQVVASRRFLPDEYVMNEALDKNLMPPKTPIYISFEIIDPGEDAVGHGLHFYPAP